MFPGMKSVQEMHKIVFLIVLLVAASCKESSTRFQRDTNPNLSEEGVFRTVKESYQPLELAQIRLRLPSVRNSDVLLAELDGKTIQVTVQNDSTLAFLVPVELETKTVSLILTHRQKTYSGSLRVGTLPEVGSPDEYLGTLTSVMDEQAADLERQIESLQDLEAAEGIVDAIVQARQKVDDFKTTVAELSPQERLTLARMIAANPFPTTQGTGWDNETTSEMRMKVRIPDHCFTLTTRFEQYKCTVREFTEVLSSLKKAMIQATIAGASIWVVPPTALIAAAYLGYLAAENSHAALQAIRLFTNLSEWTVKAAWKPEVTSYSSENSPLWTVFSSSGTFQKGIGSVANTGTPYSMYFQENGVPVDFEFKVPYRNVQAADVTSTIPWISTFSSTVNDFNSYVATNLSEKLTIRYAALKLSTENARDQELTLELMDSPTNVRIREFRYEAPRFRMSFETTASTTQTFRYRLVYDNGIYPKVDVQFTSTLAVYTPHTVTTSEATNISSSGAQVVVGVSSPDPIALMERGVCVNTTGSPTTSGNCVKQANTLGPITSTLSNLEFGTTYHARGYAIGSRGATYGNSIQFRTDGKIPEVRTTEATEVQMTQARLGGEIVTDGREPILTRNLCVSTSSVFNGSETCVSAGTGSGSFSAVSTNLQKNTNYWYRATASNRMGTAVGEVKTFKTGDGVPVFSMSQATSITNTGATVSITITTDGGIPITSKGICLDTASNPTFPDKCLTRGSGSGSFTHTFNTLKQNTVYYTRAYIIQEGQPKYSNQVVFTSGGPPVVSTSSATSPSPISVTVVGNVLQQGTTPITRRGVCVATHSTPGLNDRCVDATTSGLGQYTVSISGLEPSTTYFARAFASNQSQTGYGQAVSVTTREYVPPTVSATKSWENNWQTGGVLVLSATNGLPPYQYSIDGGLNYSTTNRFTGLTKKTYRVVVRDSRGRVSNFQNVFVEASEWIVDQMKGYLWAEEGLDFNIDEVWRKQNANELRACCSGGSRSPYFWRIYPDPGDNNLYNVNGVSGFNGFTWQYKMVSFSSTTWVIENSTLGRKTFKRR